jgi:outer membrane receptor protein involved in Fe transport
MRTLSFIPVSVLLLLPSTASLAASDNIIDEIITTAERRDSQADVVGNIAVVGKQTLEDIGALHIEDTLVRLPGVSLQQGNGQEYLPAIRSAVQSGGGACGSFLTAQDSIPLKAAGFCNINELFEANTEQAQRIEVIRGPSNALYGSNAQHGVVNVILPSAPDSREVSLGFEAGAYDFRREKFSYGDKSGNHGFLININATHDGGYRDDAYYDQQKMQLRHETKLADWNVATTFAATNLNQETAGFIEGTEAYKDRGLSKQNANPEAFRDARSFRLYSTLQTDLAANQSLVITPYLRKTEMEFLQHFLPGTPLEENGQESVGVNVSLYGDSADAWHWIVGLDTEITNGFLKETQAAATFGPFPTGKHYDYEVDALQAAPFVQLEWSPSDPWTFTAGLRFETMRYDYDNLMVDGRTFEDGTPCPTCRYTRPVDREDTFNNWSPKLGTLYRLTENHSLFADIASGFRAPQATELYRLQQNQTVANLDSEVLDSLEVGLRGYGANFHYEAVVYAMKKDNIIFRDAQARTNLGDGKTKHQGLELNATYEFSADWDINAVINVANHRYDNDQSLSTVSIDGNQEDTAPKHFGSAHLGWRFIEGARAELEYVYMGGYFTDPENTHEYEGHELFNLRIRWSMNDQWSFTARVLNITDTEYADRADVAVVQGMEVDRYFPGTPRAVFAGVSYGF